MPIKSTQRNAVEAFKLEGWNCPLTVDELKFN